MKRILLISLFFLVVIPVVFTSCVKFYSTKDFEASVEKKPFDAIIVPGFPFEGENWHDIMKMRVLWSHYLYKKGITKNIIYSGSAVYSPYIESKIMKLYAIELGIPETCIYTEEKAEHSTENIYYAYHLAKKKGFNKIALSTDPYQTLMLKKFARKKGLKIDYLPVLFEEFETLDKPNPQINPSPAFVEDFVSIKEREGFFKRWKGTLGKNIQEIKEEGE